MCTAAKIRANTERRSEIKIFHREVSADDGSFYQHHVCRIFPSQHIMSIVFLGHSHIHLWEEPGNWTRVLFCFAKFMEMRET